MKHLLNFICAAFVASAFAAPEATVTGIEQDSTTKRVTIAYDLVGGPAIVTLSATVGGQTYEAVTAVGDVNVQVAEGNGHLIHWTPKADMGNAEYAANAVTVNLKAWSPATPPDYMAISLLRPNLVRYFIDAEHVPGGVQATPWKTEYVLFRRIPAKNVRWRMGSPSTEANRHENDQASAAQDMDTVYVTTDHDYYLAVYETTAQQYFRLTGAVPSTDGRAAFKNHPHNAEHQTDWKWHPVTDVSGDGADAAAATLATKSGLAFRLPTEEEWEFACRAGSGDPIYGGYKAAEVAVAFTQQKEYYGGTTPHYACAMPVGMLKPNAFGLYDMLGNVREWCSGWYDAAQTLRPIRGCDCAWSIVTARAASRRGWSPAGADYRTGFRLCLPIE